MSSRAGQWRTIASTLRGIASVLDDDARALDEAVAGAGTQAVDDPPDTPMTVARGAATKFIATFDDFCSMLDAQGVLRTTLFNGAKKKRLNLYGTIAQAARMWDGLAGSVRLPDEYGPTVYAMVTGTTHLPNLLSDDSRAYLDRMKRWYPELEAAKQEAGL